MLALGGENTNGKDAEAARKVRRVSGMRKIVQRTSWDVALASREGKDCRECWLRSCFQDSLRTTGLRACIRHAIVLAVKTDDEHGSSMHIAARLVWGLLWSIGPARRDVAHSFTKTTPAEFLGAAEKIDGVIGTVRSNTRFHGAEMFVTEGEYVRPHDCGECSIRRVTPKSEYGVARSAVASRKTNWIAPQPATGSWSSHSHHDPKTKIWGISLVLAQKRSENEQAAESGHIQIARSSTETRTRRAVL